MVKDEVWARAWAGRLKPWHALGGQQILCIGCLEKRLGRTLTACDFMDVPINDITHNTMSARLPDRFTAGTRKERISRHFPSKVGSSQKFPEKGMGSR
jgi:hypothetical protein